jgi:dihydropteroate synthase
MLTGNKPSLQYSLNVKGNLMLIDQPMVMGILNVTEDSFYDGGRYARKTAALNRALQMLEEGADIIDIGGMSSRPGSAISDAEEELKKVLPVVEAILEQKPEAILSIDTLHARVADACLKAGAAIVNDISAGTFDANMLSVTAEYKAPIVLMHMQGLPDTMQHHPHYQDVVTEILDFFNQRIDECLKAGIHDIIIDPGFGFGKTTTHNFSILNQLDAFQMLHFPILTGLSRKSMIWKTLETNAEQALNGTTALNMVALMKGANMLRVHDVKEAKECVRLFAALKAN